MSQNRELREFVCPACGREMRLDPRFVQWCVECGHGADPNPPQPGKREGRRLERERTRSARLFESLITAPSLRPTSASGLAVTALSSVAHLVTLAVLVLPIWLVVITHGAFLGDIALILGGLTFLAVLPRWALRRRRRDGAIGREQAPNLYVLLDQCAAELGCEVPAQVFVDARYNASTGRSPLWGGSFLVLGMPLWAVLSGQERIALLGHELGHQVNGDPGHGNWAGAARWSLAQWMRVFDPSMSSYEQSRNMYMRRVVGRRAGMGGIAALLAPAVQVIVFLPFYLVALGCSTLLTRLDLLCGQRAEYLADELGARLAGSEAADGMLGKLALDGSVEWFINAARARPGTGGRAAVTDRSDLWRRLAEFVDSIPETERQRRRLVDAAHNTRTDRTHPANHLRASLMHRRPPLAGAIKLSDDEWAGIDEELEPGARAAAKELKAS